MLPREVQMRIEELQQLVLDLRTRRAATHRMISRISHAVCRPNLELELAAEALLVSPGSSSIRDRFGACLFELRRAARMFAVVERLTEPGDGWPLDRRVDVRIERLITDAKRRIEPLARMRSLQINVEGISPSGGITFTPVATTCCGSVVGFA